MDSCIPSTPSYERFPVAFPNDVYCTPTEFSSGAYGGR